MVLLALALATVESAFMSLWRLRSPVYLWKPIRERWPAMSQRVNILLKGVGLFAVLFVVWPAGVYKLSVVPRVSVSRLRCNGTEKFLSSRTVSGLADEVRASPWEIGLGAVGLVAALIVWRKLEYRRRHSRGWLTRLFSSS